MRVVIDTNVIFSGLYRPDSYPGQLLLLGLDGAVDLFAPDTVRAELGRILRKKLGYSDSEWQTTLEALPIAWIDRLEYEDLLSAASTAISDPSDASVLATALLLGAGVVSGDKAFHPLKRPVVRTWRPRDAVESSARRGATGPHRRRARPHGHR